MTNPSGSYPANYQPFCYGGLEPFLKAPNTLAFKSSKSANNDSFQSSNSKSGKAKKLPWYLSFGKEVLINGITIAASIAGGFAGGIVGAMAAGSLTSATLGALDQKLIEKQKLDWKSVAIDGALGLIPGSVAEGLAKGGSRVLTQLTGKEMGIGAKESVKRGVIVGATDGVVMGSVGGFSQGAYESYKQDGKVNWATAAKQSVIAMLSAVVGGGLGAGAFMKFRRGRS